jgi:hypothetical protein
MRSSWLAATLPAISIPAMAAAANPDAHPRFGGRNPTACTVVR